MGYLSMEPMREQPCCPICKCNRCKEILTKRVEYPAGELHSNLLDGDFVRNKILFDKILFRQEPLRFHFKLCTECGLIFFDPRPDEKDMRTKYKITDELGDVEKRERAQFIRTYNDKRALEIYKAISKIKHIQNANVADVGGAQGLNLKYFLERNACYVVDYQKRDLAGNVQYLCQTVKDIPSSIRFAAVLFCHTLEHVVDPVQEVTAIRDILEQNGILYIEVPLGCWREYQTVRNFITHINFFSEGSLGYLLNQCGLNIRYLKARPALVQTGYTYSVVAIAENTLPRGREVNGYLITRRQMKGRYLLQLHKLILEARLKKFGFLVDVSKRLRKTRG